MTDELFADGLCVDPSPGRELRQEPSVFGPAAPHSAIHDVPRKPRLFARCRKWHADTVKHDHRGVSAVSHLLRMGCPSAVFGTISKRVINTVKTEAGLSFSHIVKKVFERLRPPIAHCYPTSAVVFVKFVRRLHAPSSHNHPRVPCRCFCVAMHRDGLTDIRESQAPAASYFATPEFVLGGFVRLPAIASQRPPRVFAVSTKKFGGDQSAEALS